METPAARCNNNERNKAEKYKNTVGDILVHLNLKSYNRGASYIVMRSIYHSPTPQTCLSLCVCVSAVSASYFHFIELLRGVLLVSSCVMYYAIVLLVVRCVEQISSYFVCFVCDWNSDGCW